MLAAGKKCGQFTPLGLAEFNPIAYIHLSLLMAGGSDRQLNRMAGVSRAVKTFTSKQGQYLAFIHLYTRLHRRPPAETDMQEYFRVSPPSVHQMVLTLERAGFINGNHGPPAASKCSLIRNPCQSYFDPRPTCQNHCDEVLVACFTQSEGIGVSREPVTVDGQCEP
jgi:hypothetical protein